MGFTGGFVGLLVAAFGGPILVYSCTDASQKDVAAAEDAFEIAAYNKILMCTSCVIVLIIVDLICAREHASTKAINEVCKAMVRIDAAVKSVFVERAVDGTVQGGPVENRYHEKLRFRDSGAEEHITQDERSPTRLLDLVNSAR